MRDSASLTKRISRKAGSCLRIVMRYLRDSNIITTEEEVEAEYRKAYNEASTEAGEAEREQRYIELARMMKARNAQPM